MILISGIPSDRRQGVKAGSWMDWSRHRRWPQIVTVDSNKFHSMNRQGMPAVWCFLMLFFWCVHLNYSNSPLNTRLMLSWEPTDMIMKYNEHDLWSLHDISLYHCHLSFDANNLPKQRPQTSYHHNGTNQTSHHLPILISTARRLTGWDGFQITK